MSNSVITWFIVVSNPPGDEIYEERTHLSKEEIGKAVLSWIEREDNVIIQVGLD